MTMRIWSAGILAVLMLAGAARAEEAYTIRIERRKAVGDVFDVEMISTTTSRESTRKGGVETKGEAIVHHVALEGLMKVEAVDDLGEATEFELTVRKLTKGRQDPVELVEPGTKVRVHRGEDDWVSLKNLSENPISESAETILKGFFNGKDRETWSLDDQFPAKGPRKVGDTWDVDAKLVAKDMANVSMKLDPKTIKGSATLQSVEKVEGKKQLTVQAALDFPIESMDMQPTKFVSGAMKMSMEFRLPADEESKDWSMKGEIGSTMVLENTLTGKTSELTLVSAQERRFKYFKNGKAEK